MRLSDADRDAMLDALRRHAAAGRLDVTELERRVAIVLAAATRSDAAAALSDLPPQGAPDERAAGRGRGRWRRGHGEAEAPAADWEPTPERFRDPRTGRVMRVWMDTAGGRHYVPDA